MADNKNPQIPPPDQPAGDDGVDMERIEEMMGGPPPQEITPEMVEQAKKNLKGKKIDVRFHEATTEDTATKKKKKSKKADSKDLAKAAEEANATLLAMAPDLGKTKIEKIEDDPKPKVTPIKITHADDDAEAAEPAAADPDEAPAEDSAADTAEAPETDTPESENGELETEPTEAETTENADAETGEEPASEVDEVTPEATAPELPEDQPEDTGVSAEPETDAEDTPETSEESSDDAAPDTPEAALTEEVEAAPAEAEPPAEDALPLETPVGELLATEEELPPPEVSDDPLLSEAVDDIVAHESDVVLAAEDGKKGAAPTAPAKVKASKPPAGARLKEFFTELWHTPAAKWTLVCAIVAAILAAGLVPASRYFVMNTAGVRVSANLTVIDNQSQQPLKNVNVTLGTTTLATDSDGKVSFAKQKQGSQKLVVHKAAYADIIQTRTLGWGSNPLGQFSLTPSGVQYQIVAVDFLSAKPLTSAEATSGEGDASADKDGKMLLSLDKTDDKEVTVTITADNYRSEKVKIPVDSKAVTNVKMVPARKHVFLSKKSGKFDVYTIDADGKNEAKLVAGNGLERDDITLVPHPSATMAALVASRENVRNKDGYLLSTLYIVDTKTGTLTKVDQSEQIQMIGWTADQHIAFVKVAAGTSGSNPKRQRLMLYDAKVMGNLKELAAANYFNDVAMLNDQIYYTPSNAFQDAESVGLFRVNADGSNKTNLLNKEVWNIYRSDYDTLNLSVEQLWYTIKIGAAGPAKQGQSPSSLASRTFLPSPNKQRNLWIDQRDGKGVLLDYNATKKADTVIFSQKGISYPAYWLNDSDVIYRVNDGSTAADYVISVDKPDKQIKITDVSNTEGLTGWLY